MRDGEKGGGGEGSEGGRGEIGVGEDKDKTRGTEAETVERIVKSD